MISTTREAPGFVVQGMPHSFSKNRWCIRGGRDALVIRGTPFGMRPRVREAPCTLCLARAKADEHRCPGRRI